MTYIVPPHRAHAAELIIAAQSQERSAHLVGSGKHWREATKRAAAIRARAQEITEQGEP